MLEIASDINNLLQKWDEEISEPSKKLMRFCEMLINEQDNLMNYGCPMGTLTGEFSKNEPELYNITLPMFRCFRDWLVQQYLHLNYPFIQADEKAMELLSRVQGISVITHVFKDKKFLNREIEKLKDLIYDENTH